jgi:RNA polymerase sigma-70 factor (ECF subfamily)
MLLVRANGSPALAQYKPSKVPGRLDPWAIHLLTVSGDRISGITNFLETGLFTRFGLPPHLEE